MKNLTLLALVLLAAVVLAEPFVADTIVGVKIPKYMVTWNLVSTQPTSGPEPQPDKYGRVSNCINAVYYCKVVREAHQEFMFTEEEVRAWIQEADIDTSALVCPSSSGNVRDVRVYELKQRKTADFWASVKTKANNKCAVKIYEATQCPTVKFK